MAARKDRSALEAVSEAQRIACAPFEFTAAACLRDFGILEFLNKKDEGGATSEEIQEIASLGPYAARVLLTACAYCGLIEETDGRYRLSKTGWFLANDPMTRANFDFAADVCAKPMLSLRDALRSGSPDGLRALGPWSDSIYPHLAELPEPARASWFRFDHFYSDSAFDACLPIVFRKKPLVINDIGGNTGKWAVRCCRYSERVRVRLIDLPEQCRAAARTVELEKLGDRIELFEANLLEEGKLPGDADCWWMSQFLDCFSEEEALRILGRIRGSMKPGSTLFVLEPLVGEQPFEIGNRVLAAFSLYFTAVANGRSRFYTLGDMKRLAEKAGFTVVSVTSGLGTGHTLLELGKAP